MKVFFKKNPLLGSRSRGIAARIKDVLRSIFVKFHNKLKPAGGLSSGPTIVTLVRQILEQISFQKYFDAIIATILPTNSFNVSSKVVDTTIECSAVCPKLENL